MSVVTMLGATLWLSAQQPDRPMGFFLEGASIPCRLACIFVGQNASPALAAMEALDIS